MSPPSSQFSGFPDKVAVPCPNTLSLDSLACRLVRSMSLGLVTHSYPYFTGEEDKTQKTELRPDLLTGLFSLRLAMVHLRFHAQH